MVGPPVDDAPAALSQGQPGVGRCRRLKELSLRWGLQPLQSWRLSSRPPRTPS